jgi:predicted amidohydrolase YtcJ
MGSKNGILLTNGSIYTMDPQLWRASSVFVRDERIAAVGGDDLREIVPADTPVVDLGGRCVIPGLTDSHIHFTGFALALKEVDLVGTESLEDAIGRVAIRASVTPPGEWVKGRGWDQERWPDRQFPSAADLDAAVSDHPVVLTAKSGHASVANSRALQLANITSDTPDPKGGQIVRDQAGVPTGLLLEKAMKIVKKVLPPSSSEKIASALPEAFERAWQVGLTSVHDMSMTETEDRTAFFVYQQLEAQGRLRLRVVKYLPDEMLDSALDLGLRSGLGSDWLRVGGIKLFMDGALGARTAAMLEPYDGYPENLGILTTEREELADQALRATAGGLSLAIHALGDRANRIVLDELEAAAGTEPDPGLRHRIEHVQVLHPDDVGRLADLGVIASMQPIHAVQDAPMADRYWGDRCRAAYAWQSLLDAGTVLAFGSDSPVEDLNPFLGIQAAVTRTCPDGYCDTDGWYPEQAVSVEEAVKAYTVGAAYAVGMENRLGTLSAGKLADLVVLDQDVLTCDSEAIAETGVLGTMVAGEWALEFVE